MISKGIHDLYNSHILYLVGFVEWTNCWNTRIRNVSIYIYIYVHIDVPPSQMTTRIPRKREISRIENQESWTGDSLVRWGMSGGEGKRGGGGEEKRRSKHNRGSNTFSRICSGRARQRFDSNVKVRRPAV